MRNKAIMGLIVFGTLMFILPQMGFSYDLCLQSSSGYKFYLTFNRRGSGFTGYINVGGNLYPLSGSWSVSGSYTYANIDTQAFCGDGQNAAKYVMKLSYGTGTGPAWAYAFRCDGTIDMFSDLSFGPCNGGTAQIVGPTEMEE